MQKQAPERCWLCPHACRLQAGEIGFCHARQNVAGKIVPLARNRPCTIAVDPIEKKPLYHFYPGSDALSLGMAGCNLHCRNCQNAGISQTGPLQIPFYDLTPEALVALLLQRGIRTVAYTYTEPLVAFEYVLECAARVREAGGLNVLVSAAYVRPEPLLQLLPFLDAANIDLKSMSDTFYRSNCAASLSPVLDAVRLFRTFPICLEITNLVIPGLNDSRQDLCELSRFVHDELGAETPVHFSRFFPQHLLAGLPPTPLETLHAAEDIARAQGLQHVYLGNLAHEAITCCTGCGYPLLIRKGYQVVLNRVTAAGTCPVCQTPLYGSF